MNYILFNPLSNNSWGEEDAHNWARCLNEEPTFVSVIGLDFKKFFDELAPEDEVILAGGDGTVNRFANDTYGFDFKNPLYYVKCGTGNDFYRDVEQYEKDGKIDLRPFLKNLPLITVNGIKRRFLNGIGFGLDGECCLEGDKLREANPGVKVDYTKIAISLLLGKFKLRKASVEVDGKKADFKNVWLSSAMFGKFYGGGMMAAPNQDRLNNAGSCTLVTFSSWGRFITLLRFPTFSGGQHTGKKWASMMSGKHIKVTFDIPCALQIDGDTVKDVSTYTVDFD